MKEFFIVVTGTPGVGKTTVAKALEKSGIGVYMNTKKIIDDFKIGFDKKRDSKIINEKSLCKFLDKKFEDSEYFIISDSQLLSELKQEHVKLCVVLTLPIKILKQRLKQRKYNKNKIKENIQAEIMEICFDEAKKSYNEKCIKINNLDSPSTVRKIIELLKKQEKKTVKV